MLFGFDVGEIAEEEGAFRRRGDRLLVGAGSFVESAGLRGLAGGRDVFLRRFRLQHLDAPADVGQRGIAAQRGFEIHQRFRLFRFREHRFPAADECRHIIGAIGQHVIEMLQGRVVVFARERHVSKRRLARIKRRRALQERLKTFFRLTQIARLEKLPPGVVGGLERVQPRIGRRQNWRNEIGEPRDDHRGRHQLRAAGAHAEDQQDRRPAPHDRAPADTHRDGPTRSSTRRGTSASMATRPSCASWLTTRACL